MLGRDGSDTTIRVASRSHPDGPSRAERPPATVQRDGGPRGDDEQAPEQPGAQGAGASEGTTRTRPGATPDPERPLSSRMRATTASASAPGDTRRATSVSDSPPDTTVTVVDAGTAPTGAAAPAAGPASETSTPTRTPRTRASTTIATARRRRTTTAAG